MSKVKSPFEADHAFINAEISTWTINLMVNRISYVKDFPHFEKLIIAFSC